MKTAPNPLAAQLALDCSFGGLSLGLRANGKLYSRQVAEARASDKLLPLLAEILAEAQTPATVISQVIVTVGPGSFTGIRLGLAVAQGLKLANPELDIIGISTLTALAAQVSSDTPFTLLLDAAGGQVYRQDFKSDGTPLSKPACGPLAGLKKLQKTIAVQSGLLAPFPTQQTLTAANPETLLGLISQPALHLPPQPFYLKALAYKQVA
jgi:tRNA threonylcarbamoyladenosine biosynthesis protein TsaB